MRWLGALVGVAVVACGSPDEPAEEPRPCTNDPRQVRLWTFTLSHPDTVTLKNTSDCPVEIGGLVLVFDDRDDAFAEGIAVDCSVRLPPLVLDGRASARVSELPFPGEIDALAHEISGCAYPLSFNPDRGGVTYLCDGPCTASAMIDAVAHLGDDKNALYPGLVNPYREPPALRFGARFDAPVWGSTQHNDGLVRYQRAATDGEFPAFVGSDWGLASRVLGADFEDGVRARFVQSSPVPWAVLPGEMAEIVTTPETSAWLASSLRLTHHGSDGASVALGAPLDEFSTPQELSYFARVGVPNVTAANLGLFSDSLPLVELGFEDGTVGATAGSTRAEIAGSEDAWTRLELRDIDWRSQRFDLYVDGALVERSLAFAESGTPTSVRLGSFSAGSTAYFDAVELWSGPYAMGPPVPDDLLGVVRCGAGSGDEGDAAGPVCDDIDGSSSESATCASFCSAWDAICCGENFAENYASKDACLADCAGLTREELCCRAFHGSVGGPERCRYALGLGGVCGD